MGASNSRFRWGGQLAKSNANFQREKLKVENPEVYIISGQTNAICGRLPNEDSHMFVFDYVNTVTVDNCSDCMIVFGAVKTSIFIRNCDNCVILAACQQFRVRDSKNITAFVAAVSEPIIETSSGVHFAPFQFSYPQLNVQFHSAGLNQFNCSYSSIHDFSARSNAPINYDFLEPSADIRRYVLLPSHLDSANRSFDGDVLQRLKSVHASLDPDLSIVPPTYACLLISPNPGGAFALIGLFNHTAAERHARQIITSLRGHSIYLVRSRCLQYTREDITRIFGDSTLAQYSELGPMIMLQFHGPAGEVGLTCQSAVKDLVAKRQIKPPTLIHVTQDSEIASRQADMLARFPVSRP
ncbi:hypothetical protein Aperf_G00000046715 [Anoplocephala perfoliata]